MIRTSESITAISPAFVAFQADAPAVPKKTKGQVGNAIRFYSDLATVIETVQPILSKHGLGYIQAPSNNDHEIVITTRILHISGEWFEDSLGMPADRLNAQGVGSAISYGKRYALVAMLGLATDDDDGAAASKPQPARKPPANVNPDTGEIHADLATPAQIQRLQITLKGTGTRDEILARLSAMVGRQLTSSKELTKAEAGRVIDHLEQVPTCDT